MSSIAAPGLLPMWSPVFRSTAAPDPTEAHDVAAEHPEVVGRLEATLERFRRAGRSVPLHGDAPSASAAIVQR